MKRTKDLKLGFNDASSYRLRENKKMFDGFFVRTNDIAKLVDPNVSFLVGDKGTGKTAYAVHLSNCEYKNTSSFIKFISETEYQKFVELKKKKHLVLSDYSSIWKVILYLLLAEKIRNQNTENFLLKMFSKLNCLYEAIDEFYASAFAPEILNAISFVEDSKVAAELFSKHLKAGGEERKTVEFSEQRMQINLFYIQKKFEEALRTIRIKKNMILFIDGIDVRPSFLSQTDYLECIKGLASAIWSMNNDFFPSLKDPVGRMKVVLLARPDIFNSFGLQNQNAKLIDNSVLLNWHTTYPEHRDSKLFELADKILKSQQDRELKDTLKIGDSWDHYFPYKVVKNTGEDPSFISFLRYAIYRPRDIITMMKIMQQHLPISGQSPVCFEKKDFDNPQVKRAYSAYFLGEIKDYMSFYYELNEYDLFVFFFTFLDGSCSFTYDAYLKIFEKFKKTYVDELENISEVFHTEEKFLQFLYELNVINYIQTTYDGKLFFNWCFKDRNQSNLNPKVKLGQRYEVHYALGKSLNLGSRFEKGVY